MEGADVFLISLDGREMQVQISTETLVTPFITIIMVISCLTGKKLSVMIFPDSIETERFREMRVLVKWGGFDTPG